MQVDVIDLCPLLECFGLKIKSVDSIDTASQPQQSRLGNTITMICNSSGLRVVMESENNMCSCPENKDEKSGDFWQVSGVSHGVVENIKETGSSLLGSLPDKVKRVMTRELQKIIEYSRSQAKQSTPLSETAPIFTKCILFSETDVNNQTSSLTDLNLTPNEERKRSLKVDTPTRYRSLDTLTNVKNLDEDLPAPGQLVAKTFDTSDMAEVLPMRPSFKIRGPFQRQQTYTRSTPDRDNVMLKSKTSSPIGKLSESMLQNLLNVEKSAEYLRDQLASLVKEVTGSSGDKANDSLISSMPLDVSKISDTRSQDHGSKNKFISSPNLSGLKKHDLSTSTLKRVDSSSTSQLIVRRTPSSLKQPSKLKRLSPSLFRSKKEETATNPNGNGTYRKLIEKPQSKLASLTSLKRMSIGSGILTPTSKATTAEGSLSTTKKKMYSHVKSTIPKPTFMVKKE